MKRVAWFVALVVGASFFAGCGGAVGATRVPTSYRVTEVTPGGGLVDPATLPRVTSAGAVVGGFRASIAGEFQAFVWTARDGMDGLGTLGGATSSATGGNQAGLIVGTSNNAAGILRGFIFTAGTMSDLGGFAPGLGSAASDINSANIIVGSAIDSSGNVRPVQFGGPGFLPNDLGTLGGLNGVARAVNDGGQITGFAEAVGGARRAFLTTAGGMFDLGTLGGGSSEAFDVNNGGQAVGWAEDRHGSRLPFSTSLGTMRQLDLPPGATAGAAFGINSDGVIVGEATISGNPTAVVWYPARDPRVLTGTATVPAGFEFLRATSVDEGGSIAAVIGNASGETRVVLLEPVFGAAP